MIDTIILRDKRPKQALEALFKGFSAKHLFSGDAFCHKRYLQIRNLCRLKPFDNHIKEKPYCATEN